MRINRGELKRGALNSLKGRWGLSVAVVLIYIIISSIIGVIPVLGPFVVFFIGASLGLGLIIFFLKIARNEEAEVQDLFAGFPNLIRAFCLSLVTSIFVFLWSLLLVIPGIIASFRYSMVFYILADNPEIGVMDAINQSKVMMSGHKWELFVLYLSFLGWSILASLTFGIGFLWLMPYISTTMSNFYDQIKGEPVIE